MEKDSRSDRAERANFSHFKFLLKVFDLFCAILGIFANFARFWALFAHILCANFSDLKFCVCYFVSFFHLWPSFLGYSTSSPKEERNTISSLGVPEEVLSLADVLIRGIGKDVLVANIGKGLNL